MSDHDSRTDERARLIDSALQAVGRRPAPSEEGTKRAYARANEAWRELVRQRSRRRQWRLGAVGVLAAAVLIASVAVLFPPFHTPEAAAVVVRTLGATTSRAPQGSRSLVREQDVLPIGAILETAEDARIALRLSTGHSLRLDHGTRIAVLGRNDFRLETGRAYVDSDAAPTRDAVRIRTPLASVTEVGTQFQVQWSENVLRVRVREGSVMLANDSSSSPPDIVASGEAAAMTQGDDLERTVDLPFGPAWAWVAAVSPGLDANERALEHVLSWICRELGCRLRYADARTQALAEQIELDGSLAGLTPEQTLDVLQQITTFRYRRTAGELTLERIDESN